MNLKHEYVTNYCIPLVNVHIYIQKMDTQILQNYDSLNLNKQG